MVWFYLKSITPFCIFDQTIAKGKKLIKIYYINNVIDFDKYKVEIISTKSANCHQLYIISVL